MNRRAVSIRRPPVKMSNPRKVGLWISATKDVRHEEDFDARVPRSHPGPRHRRRPGRRKPRRRRPALRFLHALVRALHLYLMPEAAAGRPSPLAGRGAFAFYAPGAAWPEGQDCARALTSRDEDGSTFGIDR